MSLSLYQSSVPVFERSLAAFLAILDKAEAHAEARKFDPTNYLAIRLAPDMFPLTRQIQTFCDHAKNASFRLAGRTAAGHCRQGDDIRRVARPHSGDARSSEDGRRRGGRRRRGPRDRFSDRSARKMKMQGADYLMHFALPNFYFHLTTAYDILRSAGVEIGKRDFLGAVPRVSPA